MGRTTHGGHRRSWGFTRSGGRPSSWHCAANPKRRKPHERPIHRRFGEAAKGHLEEGSAFARATRGAGRTSSDQPCGNRNIPVVVIGGGQAGLSVGYHLTRAAFPFVILDANARVGDVWRKRGTRCACSRPRRSMGWTACVSRHDAPSRPRTRWPTTSKLTPRGSSCRSARPPRRQPDARREGYRGEAGGQHFRAHTSSWQ